MLNYQRVTPIQKHRKKKTENHPEKNHPCMRTSESFPMMNPKNPKTSEKDRKNGSGFFWVVQSFAISKASGSLRILPSKSL